MFSTSLSHSLPGERLTRLLVNKHTQRGARQAGKVLRRAATAADGVAFLFQSRQGARGGKNPHQERDHYLWAVFMKCPDPGLNASWGGQAGMIIRARDSLS